MEMLRIWVVTALEEDWNSIQKYNYTASLETDIKGVGSGGSSSVSGRRDLSGWRGAKTNMYNQKVSLCSIQVFACCSCISNHRRSRKTLLRSSSTLSAVPTLMEPCVKQYFTSEVMGLSRFEWNVNHPLIRCCCARLDVIRIHRGVQGVWCCIVISSWKPTCYRLKWPWINDCVDDFEFASGACMRFGTIAVDARVKEEAFTE